MKISQRTVQSLLLCLYIAHVDAFWRMVCGTVQTGRIDPIVNPGGISGHCHTVAGPLNFNTTATYASYQAAYCTSCSIQQDKSAYWTPQMYYRHRNGSYEYVQHDGTVVYYLGRGVNASYIQPFPPGFRMLSGDNTVRSYVSTMTYLNQDVVANRVSFACLDVSGPMPETPYLARTNCSDGLRAQIQFQSCWDGVNLYKTDQSHVAYLSEIDNGACPPEYPVLLPHLFYEIIYAVNNIDQSDGGMFVLSNGDVTGYAFHGDFQNGWNETVLTAAISQCINTADGSITDCAPLAVSVDPYFNINCPEQLPVVNETVKGLLKALPGCNPPTGGPQAAAAAVCPIVPNLNYVPNTDNETRQFDHTPSYRCELYQYKLYDHRDLYSFCHANLYPLAGLEYGTQCYCGTILSAQQPIQIQTYCALQSYYICSGNGLEFCGAPSLLQVWQDTNYTGLPILGPPTPGNTTVMLPSGTKATYDACYTEAVNARALNGYSFTNTTGMTVELCGVACFSRNYLYFGLEYASQCYCGTSISTAQIAESSCSSPCAGNRVEYCGAGAILSVWALPGASIAGTGTSTGVATSVITSAVALSTVVPNAKYLGCYSETNPRALGTLNGVSNASVTNSLCAIFAQQLNLQYFYTEYYDQCYAGNTLNSASVPIASSTCNTPCTGNLATICGGPNALSLWNNTLYTPPIHPSLVNVSNGAAQYAYQGCYTEGNGARALGGNAQYAGITAPSSSISPSSMTVEACAAYCYTNGYPYMGVENAYECYCNGAGVINGAVLGTGCTSTCLGSPYEYCGGSSRIDIYRRVGN